jgi:hypothetical protein
VVGKEALGHLRRREAPEEGGLLLAISVASVLVLSLLCGLKLDLSVSAPCPVLPSSEPRAAHSSSPVVCRNSRLQIASTYLVLTQLCLLPWCVCF